MGKLGITNPTIEEYNQFVQKFKDISKELQRPLKYEELSKYGLPSSRWFVKHSKNKNVVDYNTFIEYEIGMIPRYNVSKEYVIKYILQLQESLQRPIKKKDLVGIKNNGIGEGVIRRYWGSFNNMKKELNLPIIQENMYPKQKSIFSIKRDIVKLCAYILTTEGRK